MVKGIFILCVLGLWMGQIKGQELDPRSYAALPINMNGFVAQTGVSSGNVVTDAALPIQNLDVTMVTGALGYVRTFGIAGKLARIAVGIPFATISGHAQLNGRDTSASRFGLGDSRIRFGINLIGSPAIDRKQFTHYTEETVVGISFIASLPTGTYYPAKLINIGTNRWGFKPEIGVSKRIAQFYLETSVGAWFYTNNTDYLSGHTLSQKPLSSIQGHVCYYFKNKMWVSADGNWFSGGQTRINNNPSGLDFDNWRAGAVWSLPIAAGQSLKLQYNSGAFTSRGYNYTSFSLAYQYIFF
jgi:hypothetical protein